MEDGNDLSSLITHVNEQLVNHFFLFLEYSGVLHEVPGWKDPAIVHKYLIDYETQDKIRSSGNGYLILQEKGTKYTIEPLLYDPKWDPFIDTDCLKDILLTFEEGNLI